MTLTCTSRYAGHGTHCQDRQHPNGLHHGHTDDQCLQWADGGAHFSKPISDCPWPPAYEVAQRAEELSAMIKARRERLTAVAVEHPDDELLRAEIDRLRYEEALATGGLGLYPPHEQRLADDYTPDWRTIELAEQHLGSIDPDLTVAVQDLWAQNAARGAEIERLRAELAKSRSAAPAEAAATTSKEDTPMLHTDLPAGRGPLDTLLADIAKTNWRVYVHDADQWQPGSSAYNTPAEAKQRQAELAARWPDLPTAIVRETRSYQAEGN